MLKVKNRMVVWVLTISHSHSWKHTGPEERLKHWTKTKNAGHIVHCRVVLVYPSDGVPDWELGHMPFTPLESKIIKSRTIISQGPSVFKMNLLLHHGIVHPIRCSGTLSEGKVCCPGTSGAETPWISPAPGSGRQIWALPLVFWSVDFTIKAFFSFQNKQRTTNGVC